MDDRVLLHIHVEQVVHRKLEKLPQHADRHGKAERHQRQKHRRELEMLRFVAVEQIHHGKAERRADEARRRVQHGVPVRVGDEIALELAEDLGGENEDQDNDLQRARQLDAEVALHEPRQHEQDQHQHTHECALIVLMDDRHDHDADDDQTQDPVDGHDRRLRFIFLVFLLHLFQDLRVAHIYPRLSVSLFGFSPVAAGPRRDIDNQVQHQRQRERRKHIQNGVLLDKHRGRADRNGNDDRRDAHLF